MAASSLQFNRHSQMAETLPVLGYSDNYNNRSDKATCAWTILGKIGYYY